MFNNDLPESLYLQGEREAEIEQLRREEQGEITVMMDSDLPEQFQARSMYAAPKFDARSAEFRQWCEANKVYYYARPRESFFRHEAFALAQDNGCTKLLLEDMS